MRIEERLRHRIASLIADGKRLCDLLRYSERKASTKTPYLIEAETWLTAIDHAVPLICRGVSDSYLTRVELINSRLRSEHLALYDAVHAMTLLLEKIQADFNEGLLISLVNTAQAETLDNHLDQAEDYLGRRQKEGAGVLATVVFEDTVRRIARNQNITDQGMRLDDLFTALDKAGVFSKITSKECRAASGVRNHALHAQWDDFTLDQVSMVTQLTRRLLAEHLGGTPQGVEGGSS